MIQKDLIHEGAILAGEVLCQRCGAHCHQKMDAQYSGYVCEDCGRIQTVKWVNG